jgi:hypothetical protein
MLGVAAMSDSGFSFAFISVWLLGSIVAAAMSWGHDWSLVMVDTIMGWIYVAAKLAGGVS